MCQEQAGPMLFQRSVAGDSREMQKPGAGISESWSWRRPGNLRKGREQRR